MQAAAMTDWLLQLKIEGQKTANRHTAETAETKHSSVLAVPASDKSAEENRRQTTFGGFGSAPCTHISDNDSPITEARKYRNNNNNLKNEVATCGYARGRDVFANTGVQGTAKTAESRIGEWLAAIECWDTSGLSDGEQLRRASTKFLTGSFAEQALGFGWDVIGLFGLLPVAPRIRSGCWGLITHLAWSLHEPQLLSVDDEFANLQTSGGALHRKPRRLPEPEITVPFWDAATS
jgi:hypothetical protein